MRPPVIALALALCASWAACARSAAQSPASQPAAQEIARLDGQPILQSDYEHYLFELHGKSQLTDFLYTRILEREAAAIGFAASEEQIEARWSETWQRMLDAQHGELRKLEELLAEQGREREELHAQFRIDERRRLMQDALVRRARVIDEPALRARFERDYGRGGVKIELAHLFLTRAGLRAELARQGVPEAELTLDKLDPRLEAEARELARQLAAGADFAALVKQHTHDLATRDSGGLIPQYNYDRYGEALAAAARAAAVGQPFGPVQGAAGWHIGLVRSRVSTRFEDVRDELARRLADEPASPKEQMELRQRLLAAAVIERR